MITKIILNRIQMTHPSTSDSVVFLRHCALYKFTYLLTYLRIWTNTN